MKYWKPALAAFMGLGSIAGVGFAASEYMATYAKRSEVRRTEEAIKQDVLVAQTQAQFLIDARIEALIVQRDRLKRKSNKTQEDREDLADIEREIEIARKMRRVK